MSGHNKWSTIKHKKGAADAKRGKLFTKLIKEITVSARMGGGDAGGNPRLRSAVIAAREANMPNDTIDRAIKRGTGEIDGVSYEEITYEGYGPSGVAVLVETMTDNRVRTVAEIRNLFNKHNGNMGESGSVAWMFERKGTVSLVKAGASEEKVMEAALEVGADDVMDQGDTFDVYCPPYEVSAVGEALTKLGFNVQSAVSSMVPKNTIPLAGDEAEKIIKFLNALEDNDDVQNVWANFDIDPALLEKLA